MKMQQGLEPADVRDSFVLLRHGPLDLGKNVPVLFGADFFGHDLILGAQLVQELDQLGRVGGPDGHAVDGELGAWGSETIARILERVVFLKEKKTFHTQQHIPAGSMAFLLRFLSLNTASSLRSLKD